jgi:hypothetical protein
MLTQRRIPRAKRPSARASRVCPHGRPRPWLNYYAHRCQARLEGARELIELADELTDEQKRQLNSSLKDIVADTPKTEAAAGRLRRIMSSISGAGREIVTKVVVDVATEAAKKSMGMS